MHRTLSEATGRLVATEPSTVGAGRPRAGVSAPGASPAGRREPGGLAIAVAGLVSLAVAMGIGRFAFTPLLPMMLHDGTIDLPAASWLASANYLGYLVGALLCTFQPWRWVRAGRRPTSIDAPLVVRIGLVATGVLTLGMALPLPASWPLWRFAAGVGSAVVFVATSGWCLAELTRRGMPALGGVIFAGPGAGIVVSGLCGSVMVGWQLRASTGWMLHGLLAFGLTACVWRIFRADAAASPSATNQPAAGQWPVAAGRGEIAALALAYGLAGFGYIVTATFLPVIARAALPNSHWLDLFWPIFGSGVTCGALLATRARVHGDLRLRLAGAYLVQALGIGLSLWSPSLAGFAVGSLLLGLPFTALTFFAMQEVRRLRPMSPAPFIGLLTALYGIGQIAGPPLVAHLLATSANAAEGFAHALEIASSALVLGALLYVAMTRLWPMPPAGGGRASS